MTDAPAIRELRPGDLGAVAALLRRIRGDNLFTERGVRHDVEAEPDRADAARWVADRGGVVGYAVVMRYWWRQSNDAYAWIGVAPEARRLGIGHSLAGLVDEHLAGLGVDGVYTDVVQDPGGESFARARGFLVDRVDRVSVLDPRTTDLAELADRRERAAADGYELTTLDTIGDLRALYELTLEVGDDMPSMGAPHSITFEEWQASLLRFPELRPGASAVVTRDGLPVAFSLLSVDLDSRRARNEETGTARAHRRRGLATLAKLATIRWAREHGIESILTDNAEANAGMLAINARLGYRPLITRTRWVRHLRS
jgi:GNAT superfamily N-acetyltransferase